MSITTRLAALERATPSTVRDWPIEFVEYHGAYDADAEARIEAIRREALAAGCSPGAVVVFVAHLAARLAALREPDRREPVNVWPSNAAMLHMGPPPRRR